MRDASVVDKANRR